MVILDPTEVFLDQDRPRPLGPGQTRIVLRRAAELDREHASESLSALTHSEDEPRIDAADLERIAAESGLSRESLQRALAELSGGALDTSEKPRSLQRRLARGVALAQRTFEEPPEVIEQRLFATMERSGLNPIRRKEHVTRWAPASGLRQTLGRAVDWRGSSVWTGSAIESSVDAAPGQRSSAELRGDARDLLLPTAIVTGLLLAFPAGFALLVILAVGLRAGFAPQHALACLLAIVCWAALTALVSRSVAQRRTRKLRRSMERILAELAEATPVEPQHTSS
jgi:hypothetical protein